jgi:hypothetical protein
VKSTDKAKLAKKTLNSFLPHLPLVKFAAFSIPVKMRPLEKQGFPLCWQLSRRTPVRILYVVLKIPYTSYFITK